MAVQPNSHYNVSLKIIPEDRPKTQLDRVKEIAGTALAFLGMALILGIGIALAGHLIGITVISIEIINMLFTIGIASAVGGFHLAKGTTPGIGFSSGPMSLSFGK